MSDLPAHLVRFPGSSWCVWRECSLRSAGFPVSAAARFADTAAAAAVSDADPGSGWAAAQERSTAVLRSFVDDPLFREAVAWQNPSIERNWMGRLAASDDDRKLRKSRYLRAVAAYAQRYATKNDTIGFYGPVAWATWDETTPGLTVSAGPGLLRTRTTYFENWAIEELARTLSLDPALRPWLKPRVAAACLFDAPVVHRAFGGPVVFDAAEVELLGWCDGSRSVREITTLLDGVWDEAGILARLDAWAAEGIVQADFTGPIEARPEARLRAVLGEVGDADARAGALARLDRLDAARDGLVAARGDATAVAEASGRLSAVFEELTGARSSRRDGEMYAGRTLVYEDARRDLDVTLGSALLESLAPPLSIVLDSASWLLARSGETLLDRLTGILRRHRDRTGESSMPFTEFLTRATPVLSPWSGADSPLDEVITEFQDRWAKVLGLPGDARRHHVAGESVARAAAEAFPPSPAPWPGATHLSPDLMIAARDVAAIESGDHTFVLGELHLSNNTLQARPFVEQHDDPARLLRGMESDHGDRRVFYVPTRESPLVSSRAYPSALLSPAYTYWCLHDDSGGAAGPVLPAAAMTVHLDGDTATVRERLGGRRFALLDVLDEQLSWVVANIFAPLPKARHNPRVSIDRLVLHRESWHVDAADVDWAHHPRASERYRLAQAWRAEHGIPPRVFYKFTGEVKPCFLDFTSPALVECFAQSARADAASPEAGAVGFSEMLPDLDDVWLPGPGGTYTSEFRLVCLNRPH
ncbi:lantibiotic dehydratase [Phytomonospora endophytica]|uniref:Lantibiotic dehydratase N-terminal domain-containing protein n=1 Tax=Phytomonospora endophytica TaxID=714109 RepID=A0A841FXV3_9ACTN|nr:lantibiotic dehydratase [Phytomonospora endophytica]MBB6038187.1 hypothetical protein [Phytomonospora endophytica]GIG67352.1 hypothetical protein Pen01_36470 [Phytomonospora endophytica]